VRKTILKLMVVALVLAILPAGAFGSVWKADDDTTLRVDEHGTAPPLPGEPGYDPFDYWDYYMKTLLEQLNGTNNPGFNFSLNYLNCSAIVALLEGVTQEQAALLCSEDPEDRVEGMLSYWGMAGLGGDFWGFSAIISAAARDEECKDCTETGTIVTFQTAPFKLVDLAGYSPSDLVLYKLFIDQDHQPLAFQGYASSPVNNSDGYWCLLKNSDDNVDSPVYMTSSSYLDEDTYYMIRYWVLDNGSYDLDPAENAVLDPITLAFKETPQPSSEGGGGGCVLGAASSFSLEWLFVLLAPALLIFRRRK